MADNSPALPGALWYEWYKGVNERALQIQLPPTVSQILLINDSEAIPVGSTPSTANSGSVTSNAFDVVNTTVGGTVVADTSVFAHGSQSLRFTILGDTNSNALVEWTTSLGSQNQIWVRAYIYLTQFPAAGSNLRFFRAFNASSTLCAAIAINPTGKILGLDSAGATQTQSTASIVLNQWCRVEAYISASTTTGQLEVKLFNTMDSTVPTDIKNTAATLNTLGPITQAQYGPGNTTNIAPFNMDDFGVSTSGYIGPASGPVQVFPAVFPVSVLPGQQWISQFKYHNVQMPLQQPILTTLKNSFEAFTPNGTTLTTGIGSPPDAPFDFVNIGATGVLQSDVSKAAHGYYSAQNSMGASANSAQFGWSTSMGQQNVIYFRTYLFIPSTPKATLQYFRAQTLGGTQCAAFQIPISGKFTVIDAVSGNIISTVSNPALNQWIRVEGWIYASSTNGQVHLEYYNSPDSTVPTESITSTATFNTGGPMGQYIFGIGGSANQGPVWFDEVGISNAGLLGPATSLVITPPPVFAVPAQPSQLWLRTFQHTQIAYPPLAATYILPGPNADTPVNATFSDMSASATGPNIVSQAYPGQTWTRYFEHTQQAYPPLTPTYIVPSSVANINVAAPSDQPLTVTVTGVVANINVNATFTDIFAGATGPNIVSQAYPGQTWLKNFQHPQAQVQISAPPSGVFGVTANISVAAPAGSLGVPSLTGTVANVSVDAFASFAGQTGPNIVSRAAPGQTWVKQFEHTQQPYPPLTPTYLVPSSVANINVAAPSDQPLTVTVTGVTATITVASTGAYAGAIGPNIVSQAYPGQTWIKAFQHPQAFFPTPPVAGIVTTPPANITVTAVPGGVGVPSVTGVVTNISVDSPAGSLLASVSALANITVASTGSVVSSIAGVTSTIAIAGFGGSITGGVGGPISAINVAGYPGIITNTTFGVTAAITVATSGSILVTRSGPTASVIVVANAGLAGQVIITGGMDPAQWSGTFAPKSSGSQQPFGWSGSILVP